MPQSIGLRLVGALLLFASSTVAQVLVNGNSNLPACAKSCTLLNQAAQACNGVASANQQTWACFCQSGYLTNLKTSAVGICDQFCTNPADNQQVSTWYKTNCGNDFGASAHRDNGATTAGNGQATAAAPGSNPANTAVTTGSSVPQSSSGPEGSWFSSHYQWIIMIIVLIIGLSAFAVLLTWLRKRWERKQDRMRGFNSGVTTQAAPSGAMPPSASNPRIVEPNSNRESVARTRESFMPYGYNYNRSDSRTGSQASGLNDRRSPVPRGGTPANDREKEMGTGDEITKAPAKRVLVRERSAQDSMNTENEKF